MALVKATMVLAVGIGLTTAAPQLGDSLAHGMNMNHSGFGGIEMEQTFTKYNGLPLGESALKAAGWIKAFGDCDKNLGFAWTPAQRDNNVPPRKTPLTLYTTAGGQPSGVGVDMFGGFTIGAFVSPLPSSQVPYAEWTGGSYRLSVAFRKGDIMCSGEVDQDVLIGDTLLVTPTSSGCADGCYTKEIPLTEPESAAANWTRGSCFDGMGFHRFLDTRSSQGEVPGVSPGTMTWDAENLFPVVAMYHEGQINAIFFNTWAVQSGLSGANTWEPIPLENPEWMCKNFCDGKCGFKGTADEQIWFFSTMHIFFRNHREVTCAPELKCFVKGIGCCPANEAPALLV